MDDLVSLWDTWVGVSIQSVQLNVTISDMSIFGTYVLLRNVLIVPGSK